jgi:hypothetical protein
MNQMGLPLDWPADEDAAEFIVTESNRAAVDHLDRWGSWPVRTALLTGPRKSGRSLLGRIFAAKTGAHLIDDVEIKPELLLFHAWNAAQETGRPLLLVAGSAPPEWAIRLPDLKSRIGATPVLRIGDPDEQLAALLIERLLARRGLSCPRDVAAYAAGQIARTHVAILRAADAIDEASLSQKRAITLPFVRDVLRARRLVDMGDGSHGEEAHGLAQPG